MTHSQSSREIEAELERDRASLASTIDALQDRVSIDSLAREALGTIRSNAAYYSSTVDAAVRANPIALAVTGVGLAWLIFGGGRDKGAETDAELARARHIADPYGSYDGVDDDWAREADSLRSRASASLRRIEADAKSHYADLRAGIADRTASARDFASERAAVVKEFSDGLRRSFSERLDDLSDTARERIVVARERAYAARLRAERMAKGGRREIARGLEEHPMVAGAVALALGAALASALPRTRTEDQMFGERSDELMGEAARVLRSERERAMRVAEGIGQELKTGVKETLAAAGEKAAEAGERVKDRAEAEVSKSPKPMKTGAGGSSNA